MNEPDERPWEQPWVGRRDCDPHRGDMLLGVGRASQLLGGAGLIAVPFVLGFVGNPLRSSAVEAVLCFLVPLPGVLGVAVGLTGCVLAWRDTNRMRAGLMD